MISATVMIKNILRHNYNYKPDFPGLNQTYSNAKGYNIIYNFM